MAGIKGTHDIGGEPPMNYLISTGRKRTERFHQTIRLLGQLVALLPFLLPGGPSNHEHSIRGLI